MADVLELGAVVTIQAESVGVPGQRRFRIRAMNDLMEIGTIWMEKEQLRAVGEALETTLRDEGFSASDAEQVDDAVLPLSLGVEIQAAQLSMGLSRDVQQVVLTGADGVPGEESVSSISAQFSYPRAHRLQQQIAEVVAAGRPLCPLCTAPMDPAGHVCVRTNGHHPH